MNENDKAFINKVWAKVDYIEHVRLEDEKVKQYKKIRMKKNIGFVLAVLFVLSIVSIPVLFTVNFNMTYILVLGMCMLGFSAYYENYLKEI